MSEPLIQRIGRMSPATKAELLGLALDIITMLLIGFLAIGFRVELGASKPETVLFVLCAWIWARQTRS